MFLDSSGLPANTRLAADLAIVGAGPAGISIAREFIGIGLKVVLLEAGGLEMNLSNQALYAGENVGLPYPPLQTARSRYFGGSSNCWGGLCRPFDEVDFEKREWVPYSGWPFGRSELEPYYERAQELCGLGPYTYELDAWKRGLAGHRLAPFPISEERVVSRIVQSSKRSRFGLVYRDAFARADNVQVYLHANLLEIETEPTTQTVTGLRVATRAGQEFYVQAKYYVMAMGGLENPRFLLLSNRHSAAGLGNQYDLVGRFFMEHPRIQMGNFVPEDKRLPIDDYDLLYLLLKANAGLYLSLTEKVSRSEQLLKHRLYVERVFKGEEGPGGLALRNLFRAAKKSTLPDHFMDTSASFWLRNISAALVDLPNTAKSAVGRLTLSPHWVERHALMHILEPAPNPDSRVTLGANKDRFGLNSVRLDWRLTELEERTLERGQKIIGGELKRHGCGTFTGERVRLAEGLSSDGLLCCWHHMGTTRMHQQPRYGVVDVNARVHGMNNLYIAGSSVFPTGGTDFPTMTIVAMALRLADHLKAQFGA